jgi:MFS family permease
MVNTDSCFTVHVKHSRFWLWALGAAVLMQTLTAFLTRIFPVIGPDLTSAVGVPSEYIGYLAAVNSIGTMWYLVAAGNLLPRLGPLRALQLGILVGLLGLLLALLGTWWALALASLLIGFGYGPSPTAGSEVLMQYAPARHRSFVFSVKQSGVPLGGAIAGVLVPALLAFAGWRGACILSVLLVMAMVVLVEPLRSTIDRDRDRNRVFRLRDLLDPRMLRTPLHGLSGHRPLLLCTVASACFAIAQGNVLAFFVTYAMVHVDLSLAVAGIAFSIMQLTGVGGRVLAGWIADRTHSPRRVMIALGVASSLTIAVLASMTPSWPGWAVQVVAAIAGVASTSWNGVFMAELSQLAPRGRVGEVAAAATYFTFIGYVVGPATFGWALTQGISYPIAFAMLALVPLCGVIALALVRDRLPETSRRA